MGTGFPEARSHLCICRSLLPHDLCHGRSSSRWLPAKWVLGSISTNKATEGDGIPAELFKILKDGAVKVSADLENSAVATGLEKVSFLPVPVKGNAKECSHYCTVVLILRASKAMLKILQARLQQYVN